MTRDLRADVVELDHRSLRWIQESTRGAPETAARGVTFLGSGWMVLPMLVVALRGRYARDARRLLVVVGVTSGAVALLKAAVGRPRPFRAYADVLARVVPPSDASLPSGHAAGSFAVATFLACVIGRSQGVSARAAWAIAAALMTLAALIAVSRVVLGVHYPLDVTIGAILGCAFGWIGEGWMGRGQPGRGWMRVRARASLSPRTGAP